MSVCVCVWRGVGSFPRRFALLLLIHFAKPINFECECACASAEQRRIWIGNMELRLVVRPHANREYSAMREHHNHSDLTLRAIVELKVFEEFLNDILANTTREARNNSQSLQQCIGVLYRRETQNMRAQMITISFITQNS